MITPNSFNTTRYNQFQSINQINRLWIHKRILKNINESMSNDFLEPRNTKSDVKFNFKNTRVLLRVDFNIPLNPLDLRKAEKIIPTIKGLIKDVYSITIISHFKRPSRTLFDKEGMPIYEGPDFSYIHENNTLRDVYELLKQKFKIFSNLRFNMFEKRGQYFSDANYVDDPATPTKNIEILENTRLYDLKGKYFIENIPKKEKGKFINSLKYDKSQYYDLYIFDAFSAIHRGFIEMNILPQIYGASVLEGVEFCQKLVKTKFDLIFIGGCKNDKLLLIDNLRNSKTKCYLMGTLAYTIQIDINRTGKSRKWSGVVLPIDYKLRSGLILNNSEIRPKHKKDIIDIGPRTVSLYASESYRSRTVLFNGTPGVFERRKYSAGTVALLTILNGMCKNGSEVYVIGADTNSALNHFSKIMNIKYLNESIYRHSAGGAIMSILVGDDQIINNFKDLKIDFKE